MENEDNIATVESDHLDIPISYDRRTDRITIFVKGKCYLQMRVKEYDVNHMISCLGTVFMDIIKANTE